MRRFPIFRRGIRSIYCVLIFTSISWADEATRRRFEAEYPAAAGRLRDVYSNLRMRATQSLIDDEVGREEVVKEIEYGSTSGSFCGIFHYIGDGLSSVHVASPDGLSFRLYKDSDSSGYTVDWMGTGSSKNMRELIETIRSNSIAPFSPFSVFELDILDFLREKSLRIVNVDGTDSGPVKVEWVNPASDTVRRRGWFEFSPEASWALQEYEFRFDSKDEATGDWRISVHHGKMEYSGTINGFPLIKNVEMWGSGPNGRSQHTTLIRVVGIDQESVDRRMFDIETYGIRLNPAPARIPIMYYLIALSALCGLLALVFRYFQRRSSNEVQ